ncbi:MAG TPA: AraC family transcriptional regulator [Xanthobacteraceae bacterium]|nr:AraC family transcriptional regulator [Xanthobacteraceae bacterium]
MLTYPHVAYPETRTNGEKLPSRVLRDIDHRLVDREYEADGRARHFGDHKVGKPAGDTLAITPSEVVARRAIAWDGIKVEVIQCITHDRVELRFCAPRHLLVAYQEGLREEGETLIDEAPRSTLRTLAGKLTFVPAGCEYREWQRPRIRSRLICFYFEPDKMMRGSEPGQMVTAFTPRVLFENSAMWETAVKLAAAIEDNPEAERYCGALAIIMAHELSSIYSRSVCRWPSIRGGLAAWQQRLVVGYIQEHLAEQIALADLAALVELSRYHFCRAFKQSFGVPPHRYHINHRIERAKTLLVNTALSITEMAIALGFSETSSFSTAFREATGAAPTEYRRALEWTRDTRQASRAT